MIPLGQKLTFSKEDLEALGIEVKEILSDLECQQEDLFQRVAEAWSIYEAEKMSKTKNTPWVGAANVGVPVVMIHSDATHARYLLLMKSNENVWAGKSGNEEFVEAGLDVEIPKFLNWAARNDFEFDTPLSDWMLEVIVPGEGVLGLGWEEKTTQAFIPGDKRSQTVLMRRGPVVDHVPREDCLWDPRYPSWDAPVFSRRSRFTWSDVIQEVNEGGWDWEVVKGLKGQTMEGSTQDQGSVVTQEKEERSGLERDQSHQSSKLYDFREVWLDWPVVSRRVDIKPPDEMEEGDELATIVVFVHRQSGKVVHTTAKPYAIPGKPFYNAFFKKRSGIYASGGLSDRLHDIQEAICTTLNQAIDAVHKANTVMGVTTDNRLVKANMGPNTWVAVNDPNDVKELGVGKNIAPDIGLINVLNVLAERLSGISDPALGRETRMGGHPAPATSTLSLLQEGKKMDITGIRSIRLAISKLGLDLATLYQQFEQDQGKVVRALGREDGAKVWRWLQNSPIVGNLELDLAAISETMNPQVEGQKALATFQITANFFAIVTQYLQVAANPQAPQPLVEAMLKGLEALQTSYQRILESGDIDDTAAFLMDLEQLNRGIAQHRGASQGAVARSPLGIGAGAAQGQTRGNGEATGSGL